MFGFRRRAARAALIDRFHAALVEASRSPALYGAGGFPDTVEGRFEALSLHVLVLSRRLRALPPPAADVAQDLIDAVFAHLEIALRESGIGDFGVPKRMKKLGRAFYDRLTTYEPALDRADPTALADEIAARLETKAADLVGVAAYILAAERALAPLDLEALLARLPFPDPAASLAGEAA